MQDEIIAEILSQLTSSDPKVQLNGCRLLRDSARELVGRISPDDAMELVTAIARIGEEGNREDAQLALIAVSLLSAVSQPKSKQGGPAESEASSPTQDKPAHVGEFLVQPFASRSAVITVSGAENSRRDEHAENFLGRRLSFEHNPKTEFIKFSADSPRAHLDLPNKRLKAMCVVGRPGLYGTHFLETIHYPRDFQVASNANRRAGEPSLRYGFKLQERPAHVPHNQLDDHYHCISERMGHGEVIDWQTKDDGKSRRDYGLVQRYIADIQGRQTVLLVVAGASSLGTLGAAWWASYLQFPRPNDRASEAAVIPMPDGSKNSSQLELEAFVQVTADSTQSAWPIPQVILESLTIGNKSWCENDRRWLPKKPDLLTLVYRGGEVGQINFDGKKHRIEPGSQMFRLIKGLAEMALKGTCQWTVGMLREMGDLWENSTKTKHGSVECEYVTEQLRILRQRHLGMALTTDGDNVSLRCSVEIA